MKKFRTITLLILSASFMVSCATNPDNLENRLKRQDDRLQKFEDRQTARSDSFRQRMKKMSDNADARYENSFDRLMGHEE